MLIDDPLGFGKKFIANSNQPSLIGPKEIVEIAQQLNELIEQSYVIVAILIADNFPDAELRVSGDLEQVEFTLSCKGQLMLTLDLIGWRVEGEGVAWRWEDIKEGNPETVAENILQSFAQKGYSVFDPSWGILARKKIKHPLAKFNNWLE